MRLGWMGAAALVAAAGAWTLATEVDAQEVSPAPTVSVAPSAATPPATTGCSLRGTQPLPRDTAIYDAATDGTLIARFSGTRAPLSVVSLPAAPSGTERVAVRTSTGTGAVRLEGFVDSKAVSVFSTRDLEVKSGHLWVTGAQRVTIRKATPSELTAELTMFGTDRQTVSATAPCDAFALEPSPPVSRSAPTNARGYSTRGLKLELLESPGGKPFLSMRLAEGTSQVFWGTESRGGFVRLESRFDVAIDGWASLKELEPIRRGEMLGQGTPPVTSMAGVNLALQDPPAPRRVRADSPLRSHYDATGKPIGVVEAGASVYVMSEFKGLANILPIELYVAPPEDGGFWMRAEDLEP